MNIRSVKFQNFRCFEKVVLELDSDISVIIGANGAGKTAILDGITMPLQGLHKTLKGPSKYNNRLVNSLDFRLNKKGGISGATELCCILNDESSFRYSSKSTKTINCGVASEEWQQLAQELKRDPNFKKEIPVFCHYQAPRTHKHLPAVTPNNSATSRLDALADFDNAGTTLGEVVNWLHDLHIEELLLVDQGQDASHLSKFRQAIQTALTAALSSISDLNITTQKPRELEFTWNGEKRLFSQLSQGYRSMITLVLDYARRLVIANPWMDSPLESEGVLIIDEIDSHLHPAWQQSVLSDLRRAFPNTQIICSTHSPHILSTVEPKNIFVVDEDHQITQPTSEHTLGVESYRILTDIFGVSPRPEIQKIEKKIDEVKQQIKIDGKIDEALDDLKRYLGDNDPIVRNFRAKLIALARK